MDRSSTWRTRFDVLVNVVILATCVVMATAVVQRWNVWASRPNRPPNEINVGDRAEQLRGVSYGSAPSTLVLYLHSSCRYCKASMPFYRQLNNARRGGSVQLVGVTQEDEPTLKNYLNDNEVAVDRIVSHQGRITQTPTLVEVAADGVVKHVWVGQQSEEQQRQVVNAVRWR